MIFDSKPTSQITAQDLKALVRDRVEEDAYLDYKRQPYEQGERGIREILKDVSAFANAEGGYLIIGIGEESGQPRRAHEFVSVDDHESARKRIIDVCLDKIEPRFRELDIRAICVDDKNILVCRIPESDQKPYCARPDPEHHYFWRRYEDGNRLMSVPEIRACLEGDRVLRELAEIRSSFSAVYQQQVISRETSLELSDANVFQVTTLEAFRKFVDEQFQTATQGKPYYRLTATPLPVNDLDLHDKSAELLTLLERPPALRPHGWDMTAILDREPRTTQIGVVRGRTDYKHLRAMWNGHVEFWTEVADIFFRFSEDLGRQAEHQFLYPYAVIEPIENFLLLVKEVCGLASFRGEVEVRLEFRSIRGMFLAPGHPGSYMYAWTRSSAGHEHGPRSFPNEDLRPASVTVEADELPGNVTWQLARSVYHSFGYPEDEAIPFFDQDRRLTLGRT